MMRNLLHLTIFTGNTNMLPHKKFLTLMLLILGLSLGGSVFAQERDASLDFLNVDLWPDYDRAAVLVLLTGSLTEDTGLPVSINIPIPENADINAVARVDAVGNLFTDIDFDSREPGNLILNLSEPSFRIEYYFPYESNGNQHEFGFDWLADIDVNQLSVTFQQPSLATNVVLSPEATNTINGDDNLLYHQLPNSVVVAGTPYSMDASYEMVRQQLSSELISSQLLTESDLSTTIPTEPGQDSGEFDWTIVLGVAGGVLILAIVGWLIVSNRRSSRRVLKPQPRRRQQSQRSPTPDPRSTRTTGKSRFCHECGQPLDPGDKFCRNCGTLVKGT